MKLTWLFGAFHNITESPTSRMASGHNTGIIEKRKTEKRHEQILTCLISGVILWPELGVEYYREYTGRSSCAKCSVGQPLDY